MRNDYSVWNQYYARKNGFVVLFLISSAKLRVFLEKKYQKTSILHKYPFLLM